MVDREQLDDALERFDRLRPGLAEGYVSNWEYLETQAPSDMLVLADSCLAILAELEQAERERDLLRESERVAFADRFEAQSAARLAKVPVLVEALLKIKDGMDVGDPKVSTVFAAGIAADALAAWESD